MINQIDNLGPNSYKALIYSAHDTTILGLLDKLNLTSSECQLDVFYGKNVSNTDCIYTHPGYASNLIFEIIEDNDTKDLYV